MPGLNQLTNFVENAQTLGDELNVRRSRGETIDEIKIPEGVADIDDSEDFLYGLPTSEEEIDEASDENAEDEDSSFDMESFLKENLDESAEEEPTAEESSGNTSDVFDVDSFLQENLDTPTDSNSTDDDFEVVTTEDTENPSTDDSDLDFSMPETDNSSDLDTQDFTEDTNSSNSESLDDDFDMPDFDFNAESDSSTEETNTESPADTDLGDANFDMPDFNIDDAENTLETTTEDSASDTGTDDLSADLDLPDFDFDSDDSSEEKEFSVDDFMSTDENPAKTEDTTFDDIDFSDIPTPDTTDDSTSDDFALDGIGDTGDDTDFDDDFSISGFTDVVEAAAPIKSKKSDIIEEEQPHSFKEFTQSEYKTFLENLNYYPLNLRFEIENMLVDNELSDEENVNVIRMIIKKTSPSKLASHVGKLLDKHIDVPRNYEKRTAAEYEAYKASAEYQLKNRILPMAIAILIIGLFVGVVAKLGYEFVYRPMRAEKSYKEGFTYLEEDAFKQSEECFYEAISFKPKKKWFFKYAEGYREKRQYDRARKTYELILQFFPKDKTGGLEYAKMELGLSNFEGAEEIVRRKVLDNFINDPDGMLLLGDIFLEWATEKDPSKFQDALEMYATVIDMYGENDLYLSRLLRYYIRTDNLREVLPLKSYFYPNKKQGEKKIKVLEPKDILALSEYLLNKLYGDLTPAEEYLREYIEDVRALLEAAIEADPSVPEAYYNYAKYFIHTANTNVAQTQLEHALTVFDSCKTRSKGRILKHIDTYRLLGELYTDQQEYLKAEELFTKGITLFEEEKVISELVPTADIGKLYSDMADLDYFISGDNEQALRNYLHACEYHYDTSSNRYRIGYIYYGKEDYLNAIVSFIKSANENGNDLNLLLALANALALRDDFFAAQGYYERFITQFDHIKSQIGLMLPQVEPDHAVLVENYMYATNNYGVVLNKLAERTGDSNLNARAMVYFAESIRAWDSMTRNQTTLVRVQGSNLAAKNMQYLSFPQSDFEPALFYDIPRTLQEEEVLMQPSLKAALQQSTFGE